MLGYVISKADGAVNGLFADLATRLEAGGLRIGGVVQHSDRAHMDLRVLSKGPTLRISQDLGPHATGCRLDSDGLERAVGLVQGQLELGPDLLILNRFGKQEAEGRGFRPVIGAALSDGVPVLIALRPDFLAAFQAFTQDLGTELPADTAALTTWVRALVPAL